MPSHQKFSFCTVKIESVEWLNLVPRSSIDDCAWIHFLCWKLCDRLQSNHYWFTKFPSALRPCHLGSFADFEISVSEESTNSVLTWCHFSMTFGFESWEIWAGASTSAISRFSAKSARHSGTPSCCSFPQLLRHSFLYPLGFIAFLLDPKEIDPSEAVSKMKLWLNSMIVLEPPMGRSSQFCRGSDSQFFWSQVAHDNRATHTCNRGHCNVCQGPYALEPRAPAQWRKYEDHAHTFAIHHSSVPVHCCHRGCIELSWVQIPFE